MKFLIELKHFLTKHPKEMAYFMLIYFFSVIQGMIIFLYLSKNHPSPIGMTLSLIIPSIPACLYSEYSSRAIGYKRPYVGAFGSFILLNSFLLILSNLDYKFLPSFYNYIFCLFIFCGFYFSRNDSCSCEK